MTAAGPLQVTCSVGIATEEGGISSEELIRLADEALYRAKRSGRDCVRASASGVGETADTTAPSTRS